MATHTQQNTNNIDVDINLVQTWLRVDPVRWIAGALAGAVAGLMALVVGMIIASIAGYEFWFPVKLMGTVLVGPFATETGFNLAPIMAGLLVSELIAMFWGVIYAHFVFTNSLPALLGMGLAWADFSWIFTWNLFMQSFPTIKAAGIPAGAAVPIVLVYGLGMTSVAFFDRAIRGDR